MTPGRGTVELLAPAGNAEALRAAVENGADAVYLGGQAFHARDRAANFEDEELGRALDYAHLKGVSVYLTVNTLLTNREFTDLAPYLERVREMGVDAFIVQDLGVLHYIRTHLPDVPVHMSTQSSIHNSRGVDLLERWGVSRIILPRELELEEIRTMAGSTKIPLEVFVHGAQCFAYSGQCLASSLIGGRSGNRGKCASTCRWPYELLRSPGAVATGSDRKPGTMDDWAWEKVPTPGGVHLESSRDMCTIDVLPQIVGAGVVSVKIEGRMRRPEYVAIVTNIYRRALDRLAKGKFAITPEERRLLLAAYNRDFVPAYFLGNAGRAFVAPERADNRGLPLGKVAAVEGPSMDVLLENPLRAGDGIEVWDRAGDSGGRVHQMAVGGHSRREAVPGELVRLARPGSAEAGDRVFKSSDLQIIDWARGTYQGEERRIPVSVQVDVGKGQVCLRLTDPAGLAAEVRLPATLPDASTKEASVQSTERVLKGILKRMAGTFKPRALTVGIAEGQRGDRIEERTLHLAWARASERLGALRVEERHRRPAPGGGSPGKFLDLPDRKPPVRPELAVACPNVPAVHAALLGGADSIYYCPLDYGGDREEWDMARLEEAAKATVAAGKRFWLHPPYITRDGDMASFAKCVPELQRVGIDAVVAGNLGILSLARSLGWRVRGDTTLNAFNGYAVRMLGELGAEAVALSPELTLSQMADLSRTSPLPLEAIVHGQLHLMISEHCIIGAAEGCYDRGKHVPCRRAQYALRDEKGNIFPLVTDGKCRMHMMNSRELAMLDRLGELMPAGLDILRIHAVGLNPANLEALVRAHVQGLDAWGRGSYDGRAASARLDEARTLALTTGHFFREVL